MSPSSGLSCGARHRVLPKITRRQLLPPLDFDGKLVVSAYAVRALDYGFLSVFLGVYVSLLGLTALQAGLVFSGIMAGGALSNAVAVWKGDTIGRRRMLVVMSAMMALGGVLFPLAPSATLLAVVGLFAMSTTTGGDRTAFMSLDMAILSQTSDASQRTLVFSWYNLVGVVAKAVGTALIALPPFLQAWLDVSELTSFKIMFGGYAVIASAGVVIYARLSSNVEPRQVTSPVQRAGPALNSRRTMLRLTGLFSVDSLGGGFMIRAFIAFWFVGKFGVEPGTLAAIFVASQLMNVLPLMLATPVARKIGLVNTMVSTQILSNLLMVGMALVGNLWVAVAFFLARELTNDMEIPTRQSYIMAIVPPQDRTAAAAVTNLGRNVTQTVSPGIAGYVAQLTFLGAPFLVGSGIKLAYNVALYLSFKGIRAPEEVEREADQLRANPRS